MQTKRCGETNSRSPRLDWRGEIWNCIRGMACERQRNQLRLPVSKSNIPRPLLDYLLQSNNCPPFNTRINRSPSAKDSGTLQQRDASGTGHLSNAKVHPD
jgi:hypothetical protein